MGCRDMAEIHAEDGADDLGWQQHDRGDREDLQDVVLVDVDHAECGVEHELNFVTQERCVTTHLLDIARRRLETTAYFAADMGLTSLQQENE